MTYPRTRAAIAVLDRELATDPRVPFRRLTIDGLGFDVREAFWLACNGARTRHECLDLTVAEIKNIVAGAG